MALGLVAIAAPLRAQDSLLTEVHNLAGPRVGFGAALTPKGRQTLRDSRVSSPYSQFGWQFEQRAFANPGGLTFVVEETVLMGGIDQGRFLPSVSAIMGVRTPSGWEAGLGPELSVHGIAVAGVVGRSLRYGNVAIPISIMASSLTRQPHITFLMGFAVESIRR
jgi:hypothetical protein